MLPEGNGEGEEHDVVRYGGRIQEGMEDGGGKPQ